MTKKDLTEKLGVSEETLNDVIRSCGYTEVKNFNAVHENVMRNFIRKADIKVYTPIQEEKQTIVKTEMVSDIIENVEVEL